MKFKLGDRLRLNRDMSWMHNNSFVTIKKGEECVMTRIKSLFPGITGNEYIYAIKWDGYTFGLGLRNQDLSDSGFSIVKP